LAHRRALRAMRVPTRPESKRSRMAKIAMYRRHLTPQPLPCAAVMMPRLNDPTLASAVRPATADPKRVGLVARRSTVLAVVALLMGAGSALSAVRLTTHAFYTGNSSVCQRGAVPGTSCQFRFLASSNGFALRFVGHTVVSSWTCRKGTREALLGGKVAGNDPVPLLILRSDGTLYGGAGSGANQVTATGHIAEAGTKVVVRFHLVHRHCVSPKVTLIEGFVPRVGH
jgi:hypothetical protein